MISVSVRQTVRMSAVPPWVSNRLNSLTNNIDLPATLQRYFLQVVLEVTYEGLVDYGFVTLHINYSHPILDTCQKYKTAIGEIIKKRIKLPLLL